MNEDFLSRKLRQRRETFSLRELKVVDRLVDFCSNDYLGVVKNNLIDVQANGLEKWSGSTGSRLISGNSAQVEDLEKHLAIFHDTPSALLFNSGYDANLGVLGSIPQRNDTVLYDQLSHASIRDGIRLSHAFSFSFMHNDVEDLERRLQGATGNIFVVTESVFSMDGDIAPLKEIVDLCESYHAHLIVDEAHATGVVGNRGEGLVQLLGLQKKCFARIHTFGKALGCHGAVVVGSPVLKEYLVNFSRPFIYTTALPCSAIQSIEKAYAVFPELNEERKKLQELVHAFHEQKGDLRMCLSVTPIQGVIIPGNEQVKRAAQALQEKEIDVRAILYPSVPKGLERLRIVLHSYNSKQELYRLLDILKELH